MNGNKYENTQLSIGSCNSYLGALTFLSNSLKKLSSKRWKSQNTEEIPKLDIHRLFVILQVFDTWWMQCHDHESNVFWVFISILIWLWVCFAKWAMFWCEFRWVLSLLYPLLSLKSCRKIFLNFFRSYFYSFFLYLLFHQIKQICFEFIWNTWVKRKQTNKQTNQQSKTKSS